MAESGGGGFLKIARPQENVRPYSSPQYTKKMRVVPVQITYKSPKNEEICGS